MGYNTNVRHKGKLFHIQTEDSGVAHPHIITHLFADGGRIVDSKKTSYAEHVGAPDYRETVKQMMKGQHKAVFIALRDGEYDTGEDDSVDPELANRELDTIATRLDHERASALGVFKEMSPLVAVPASTGCEPRVFGVGLSDNRALEQAVIQYLSTSD